MNTFSSLLFETTQAKFQWALPHQVRIVNKKSGIEMAGLVSTLRYYDTASSPTEDIPNVALAELQRILLLIIWTPQKTAEYFCAWIMQEWN